MQSKRIIVYCPKCKTKLSFEETEKWEEKSIICPCCKFNSKTSNYLRTLPLNQEEESSDSSSYNDDKKHGKVEKKKILLLVIVVICALACYVLYDQLSNSNSAGIALSAQDIPKLPEGMSSYYGFMSGYPIALRLSKESDGKIKGWYKNINYKSELSVSGLEGETYLELDLLGAGIIHVEKTNNGLNGTYKNSGSSLSVVLSKVEELRFEGKIGVYPVHMMLWKNGNTVNGIYYYDKFKSKKETNYMKLSGSVIGDQMYLSDSDLKDNLCGHFSGSFSTKEYTGTYENEKSAFDFSMKRTINY